METWGASGANISSVSGGKGAYASGYIELQKGEKLSKVAELYNGLLLDYGIDSKIINCLNLGL